MEKPIIHTNYRSKLSEMQEISMCLNGLYSDFIFLHQGFVKVFRSFKRFIYLVFLAFSFNKFERAIFNIECFSELSLL